jgi:hypothetical protein
MNSDVVKLVSSAPVPNSFASTEFAVVRILVAILVRSGKIINRVVRKTLRIVDQWWGLFGSPVPSPKLDDLSLC